MSTRVGAWVLGALVAAGLAALLLVRGSGDERGADVLRRLAGGPADAPGFRSDEASAAREPGAAPVTPLAVATDTAAAARPAAAARTVSGRVVRASDGTPLQGARVRAVRRLVGAAEVEHALRVVDVLLRGQAFGGAELSLDQQGVATDEEGRFTLRTGDLPPELEPAHLVVTNDDAWPPRPASYPLPATTGDIAGLELVHDSGFVLRGTVRDTGGTPLAGVTVGLEPMEPATTDAAGRFEFRDVAPEAGTLSVQASAQAPWYEREERSAPVPPSPRDVVTLDVTLRGSGALEGTVTGTDGAPVSSAEVRLLAETSREGGRFGKPHQRAESGGDGSYRLDHVPEGRYLVMCGREPAQAGGAVSLRDGVFAGRSFAISVSIDGLVTLRPEGGGEATGGLAPRLVPDVAITAGRATRLDLVLDEGASIEGRVRGSDGAPLAGALVRLERVVRWSSPGPARPTTWHGEDSVLTTTGGYHGLPADSTLVATEQRCVTDEDGRYRFERVSEGAKRLHAADAERRCAPASTDLEVRGTTQYPHVDFLLPLGLSVRGRVLDPAGAPLEGAAVSISPEGTVVFTQEGSRRTDADGAFELPGLPPAPQVLFIVHPGHAPLQEPVTPGGPSRDYVLTPAPDLHGLVLDAVTGEPIPRYALAVAGARITAATEEQDRRDGRFLWNMDGPEPCTVYISSPGYEPLTQPGVLPSATSPDAPRIFRLSRAP